MKAPKLPDQIELTDVSHYLDAQAKDIVLNSAEVSRANRLIRLNQIVKSLSADDFETVFQLVTKLTSKDQNKKDKKQNDKRKNAQSLYVNSRPARLDKTIDVRKI